MNCIDCVNCICVGTQYHQCKINHKSIPNNELYYGIFYVMGRAIKLKCKYFARSKNENEV